jgi:hypothetical protein
MSILAILFSVVPKAKFCATWRVYEYINDGKTGNGSIEITLVAQGTQLRGHLLDWQQQVQIQFSSQHKSANSLIQESELLLSLIYFHAISIYLSGIYDYHPQIFSSTVVLPTLSQSEIDYHLSSIIKLTGYALETNLASLLFFFPLRVAAARSRTTQYRSDVLALLRKVRCKGFAISDFFELEIRALWIERDAMTVVNHMD